ncbi:MAG TPA: SDR family NAD(P)-dependent oxidoreductase [Armatimonadota bacterium]|jgi:NAD(P)-dependent dehydrogenase (short-subunit alcohol dehydrogenase family)|nr:SDR family oxidoreductase [Armatimonadota bacterium]HOM80726.1 SDR family NAD(P)-dependent oxidoreductase [Armatimonadota bacterium]HPO71571.1 SDR family NAD(P)-dependent oxidoreductase [Armatimonadota bacterium]HPT96309.1 SDR family NAD(P)-dependent oxidoreductase [Armatimonadota bacterium]
MQLAGKVALVTGAGSGIGEASAVLFAREGARVGALDRTHEKLQAVVGRIEQSGGEAMALVADVSHPGEMESAIRELTDRWGRLDIVFANAGINGVWAPLDALSPEEWNRTLSINLTGTFLTVKYAVPYLKQNGGSVIITSSVNGTRVFSNTGATAYSCSKAGQVAFAKMVAAELAPHRVRVNVICPGAIRTDIGESTEQRDLEGVGTPIEYPEGKIPLTHGAPGTTKQVAQLALFLASEASSHITGTEVWIDGGESLVVG